MNRYIGEIENINPTYNEIELIYITIEQWQETKDVIAPNPRNRSYHHQPSFWFIYKGWMYLGVCDQEMGFLVSYDDIIFDDVGEQLDNRFAHGKMFNQYEPGEDEFNWLLKDGVAYHKFDYDKAMVDDNLGHYSQYEMDFIIIWNRDRKINKLIGL